MITTIKKRIIGNKGNPSKNQIHGLRSILVDSENLVSFFKNLFFLFFPFRRNETPMRLVKTIKSK
jgi:hypothetical protein